MVTKKDIKDLDFETIEDYCAYIMESRFNGQHQQARKLYNRFSQRQKYYFRIFLAEEYFAGLDKVTAEIERTINELQN